MSSETSPRFNWRIHQRPTPRPEEPAPMLGPIFFQGLRHDPDCPLFERTRAMSPTVAKWVDQEPAAYVDGMNWYIMEGDNPINAVNPLGT